MKTKILVINSSFFSSGAENSLSDLIGKLCNKYEFIVTSPQKSNFPITGISGSYYVPYIWFYKTLNPIKLLLFTWHILLCSIILIKIVKKHQINLIYANTTKANIYAAVVKIFTRTKIIWHLRDNMNNSFLNNLMLKYSDRVVAVSNHIQEQINSTDEKVSVVHGGVDLQKWSSEKNYGTSLKKDLALKNETLLIAQVSQLTKWKNHYDFIIGAKLLIGKYPKCHFLIVGDDLSKREGSYKSELIELIRLLGIQDYISFLGHCENIIEIMDDIDILIHPSINEPFGRVLIEAMAMEKPVVAYECGGITEIIENNKSGFLVEPFNYKMLADRTASLIENKKLRRQFGIAGRDRVNKQFAIEKYVENMDLIFQQFQNMDFSNHQ